MNDRSAQAGLLTSAEFIRFGIKSLIGIALARILIPADLGTYRQLFLIYTTFSTLLLLGIPQSALYFLPKLRHIDSQREFISRTVNLITILSFVFAFCILLFKGIIASAFRNPQLADLLILFAVYPLFMFITQIFSSVLLGMKHPQKVAVFTLFSIGCDLVLILGLALLTRNLSWIVTGVMISALLQWAVARFLLSRWMVKTSFDPEFLRDQFKYSLPVGLSSVIGILSIQLDKFVISGFFSPAQFAVFSVGAMELPFISILNSSVNAVLLPNISGSRESVLEIFRAAVRKNTLIIFPLAVLFFIYARPIITLLYSNVYLESVLYFKVYLIILPLRIATYGIIFMALRETRYIMYNSLIMLSLNLVLNLILVRLLGMIGAALATVVVTWISVAIYLWWIHSRLQLPLNRLFPLKAILRTALVVALSGGCSAILMEIFSKSWLVQILALGAFLLCYLILGKLLNAILPYDIQYLKQLGSKLIDRMKRS